MTSDRNVNPLVFPTPEFKKSHKTVVGNNHTGRIVARVKTDTTGSLQVRIKKQFHPMAVRKHLLFTYSLSRA